MSKDGGSSHTAVCLLGSHSHVLESLKSVRLNFLDKFENYAECKNIVT